METEREREIDGWLFSLASSLSLFLSLLSTLGRFCSQQHAASTYILTDICLNRTARSRGVRVLYHWRLLTTSRFKPFVPTGRYWTGLDWTGLDSPVTERPIENSQQGRIDTAP